MSHYEMAHALRYYDLYFGIPIIIMSAAVGVSAFTSITTQLIPSYAKIIVGFLSVSVVILSSLQTFFKFSERSEKHKSIGVRFGVLRRKLEHLYAQPGDKLEKKYMEDLRKEMDALASDSPNVPAHIFTKIQANIHYIAGPVNIEEAKLPTV